MQAINAEKLADIFHQDYGSRAAVFSAPGRVNLIGEHTDYNDGFVLPSAIGFYAHVAVAPRPDRKLVFRSTGFAQAFEADLSETPKKLGEWCDYVLGVAVQLGKAGVRVSGANILVHGEVPIGAGLSSSAALEVASAMALLHLAKAEMPMKQVAKLCQRAENEFVGAHVGIMDQFVSCHGRKDNAVMLDCRSLDYELVPIPESVKFVICNTMVKHELSGGEYNVRREQCEAGVQILAKAYPEVRALRDVSVGQLEAQRREMPELIYKRCLHVVQENDRVVETVQRLRGGDMELVGQLMGESHASLRDLYEVSCAELDAMVESAQGLPGFIGGRMTGGGFGGCTVNLVEEADAAEFAEKIAERYHGKVGIAPNVYVCSAADGAGAE
ncbi:MAG TPA: galactokinase [Terriglobales bacterium]|nr:galactokinase [Terriglobales bacterium]